MTISVSDNPLKLLGPCLVAFFALGMVPVVCSARSPGRSHLEYYLEFHPEDRADTLRVEKDTKPPRKKSEYYLRFESDERPASRAAGGEPQAEPDSTKSDLDSKCKDIPDSLKTEQEMLEIKINDEGVKIEPVEERKHIKIRVGRWDEPENEACDSDEFDHTQGRVDWGLGLSYQRVDGLSYILKEDLRHADWRVPHINLREIYSSKQSKWLYDAGIEQMIFRPLPIYVGASVYKITDSNPIDREIIDSSENSLAALFLKEDYRDYFTRNGTSLGVRIGWPRSGNLEIKYLNDRYSSLKKRTDWSLFDGEESFRSNPAIDEGDMRSFVVSYSLDMRRDRRCLTTGPWVRLSLETAGYDLGGDFDFTTLFLDARNYIKLSPAQFLRYRLMIGSRTDGTLPVQKEFYVGGVGTLRGHDYKELTGDQMMLGNIEYGPYVSRNVGLFVFVDSGKAWYGDGGFLDQSLEVDAGVGIELPCQQTHIYVARDLKDPDSPIRVGFRLNRTF
jgi:hypothetical protein